MPYHIHGRKILHQGQPIQLRGVSLGGAWLIESYMNGWPGVEQHQREALVAALGAEAAQSFWEACFASYYGPEDLRWLRQHGFNLIRVPLNWRLFSNDEQLGRSRAAGFALVKRILDQAQAAGLSVLLDLHAAPGSQADDWNAEGSTGEKRFWMDERNQAWTCALWWELADRFGKHPALFGYDPLCEPVWHDDHTVNAFYHQAQNAIRSADHVGIITLEANEWARKTHALDPALFDDPQTMAQGHWYPGPRHLAGDYDQASLWSEILTTLDTPTDNSPLFPWRIRLDASRTSRCNRTEDDDRYRSPARRTRGPLEPVGTERSWSDWHTEATQ